MQYKILELQVIHMDINTVTMHTNTHEQKAHGDKHTHLHQKNAQLPAYMQCNYQHPVITNTRPLITNTVYNRTLYVSTFITLFIRGALFTLNYI